MSGYKLIAGYSNSANNVIWLATLNLFDQTCVTRGSVCIKLCHSVDSWLPVILMCLKIMGSLYYVTCRAVHVHELQVDEVIIELLFTFG